MKKYKIAVVGATGAVGIEMIKMLESRRNFSVESIKFFASQRSVGKKLIYNGKEIVVELLREDSGKGIDIALFSAGATVSEKFAPFFTADNCFVVDNSSAWRMDKDVPLVVPEVNAYELKKDRKLIANPNCSTIQMVVALKPLHDFAKIKRVIVSTYQSVSGAGQNGINELSEQVKAWAIEGQQPIVANKFQYQIAFNLIPQIDVFTENGYTKEEMKMTNETKKIMGDCSIEVSATCVRVPVFRSHSESIWIETERPLSPSKAKELLSATDGIQLLDEPENKKYPMPLFAENMQTTYIGRIRSDISTKNNALTFWVVSDNLLKGAALNAVQIAETLIKNKLV
ncbi:MAG: aspartate-semialdehyde dehydrogenase [Endomicrobium sp.]|jgi:aspartate-semialdehyde dehydrogenase|nr:aspartate-semialdehyde dehydrogenase [Endomicrobium sp.]